MELFLKALRLVIGAVCLLAGALIVGLMGLAGIIFALPIILVGSLLAYPFVAEPIGNLVSGMLYSNQPAELPEQFSAVQTMLTNHRYREAVDELDTMLAARPRLTAARILKVRILYDHLQDGEAALSLARAELTQNPWQSEYIPVAMIAVDVLLDRGDRREAADFLAATLTRCTNARDKTELQQRLDHLQS